MWVRAWKKDSSVRHERISPPSKRIMRKSALRQPKAKVKRKDTEMS